MDVRAGERAHVLMFVFCSFCGVYFAGLLAQMDFIESSLCGTAEAGRASTFSEDVKDVDLVFNPFNFLPASDYAIVM